MFEIRMDVLNQNLYFQWRLNVTLNYLDEGFVIMLVVRLMLFLG